MSVINHSASNILPRAPRTRSHRGVVGQAALYVGLIGASTAVAISAMLNLAL
ncbi:MAG: hypothetical protein JWQ43_835 [Glaciihabitans sp.]|nr:hypothetical protein [Glaciihabitans sp.]